MTAEEIAKLNAMEDLWVSEEGLPERNLRKNLYAATDGNSGYDAWMLPMLRWAIEFKDAEYLAKVVPEYVGVFDQMTAIATSK